MRVKKLPKQRTRMETGLVRFGGDDIGLYITGSDAIMFAYSISRVVTMLTTQEKSIDIQLAVLRLTALRDLIQTL